jgi:hypothetical protein
MDENGLSLSFYESAAHFSQVRTYLHALIAGLSYAPTSTARRLQP